MQVGDWVIAIGSPFGYQQTVSTGIISAKGRTHVIPFVLPFIYEDFFQTDAAINPEIAEARLSISGARSLV